MERRFSFAPALLAEERHRFGLSFSDSMSAANIACGSSPPTIPSPESAALNDPIQYWAEYTEHTPTEEPFAGIDEAAPQTYSQNDWPTIRNPR